MELSVADLLLIIKKQNEIIKKQAEEIEMLKAEIERLKAQLSKNSKNSSIPPSKNKFGERYRKENNKEKQKAGGTEGHKGKNLKVSENPTEIIYHSPERCEYCGRTLENEPESKINEKCRQEIEIKIEKIIINHYTTEKCCPHCKNKTEGKYPENIKSTVQYGPTIKSVVSYLSTEQMIPINRIQKTFDELFGIRMSQGTIVRFNEELARKSEPVVRTIITELKRSERINADETGLYVENKRGWAFVFSTERLTYIAFNKNRSFKALEEIGILTDYKGSIISDFYPIYRKFPDIKNFFCNAHLLRDLTFVTDIEKRNWSKEMIDLLLNLKKLTEKKPFGFIIRRYFMSKKYDLILNRGFKEELIFKNTNKNTHSYKLLNRMLMYKDGIIGFVYFNYIPFTNNQAERDIRPIKVQQKISGTFRTKKGADNYLIVKSVISTLKKQKMPVLDSLNKIFNNQPLTFNFM